MDFKALSKNQQGALIAGAVTVVLSFFGSYVKASVDGGVTGLNFSTGHNAWLGFATFGMLLILVAVAIVATKAFADAALPDGVPWNLAAFGAAALGTILVILRALTYGSSGPGYSFGPGWSGWLLFVAGIVFSAFTFLLFKDSGEKMPEMPKKDDTPPAA